MVDPAGMTIGRDDKCDITLDSPGVSRRHAQVYRDPFGRWIVEDLNSRNGVWVGGEAVKAQAVSPGQQILVGPFSLMIEDDQTLQTVAGSGPKASARLIEDVHSSAELLSKAQRDETLSSARLKQLNELADQLVGLSTAERLYPWVCEQMSSGPGEVAMVLRVPTEGHPLPSAPETLAFCSGGHTPERMPHNLALHVSRRVLEAVRSTNSAVMAGAATDDGERMDLTVVDERKPRAVLCAPIGPAGGQLDVLYVDIPADRASEALLDYVQAVARQANFAHKGLMLAEVKAERAIIDRQLDFARQIQSRLTPPAITQAEGVVTAVHYVPAMWVGGDYCDVWMMPDGRLTWAIGDVSGKGLPAALVMAILHGALRTGLSFSDDLAATVTQLNDHLLGHTPEDLFATLVVGRFHPASGEIEYVNAGHLPLVLAGRDGQTEKITEPGNPPIGIVEYAYEAGRCQLPPEAMLLAVTDGITECMSGDEEFGMEGLCKLAAERAGEPARSIVGIVAEAAKDFEESLTQRDDTTVLAISRSPAE